MFNSDTRKGKDFILQTCKNLSLRELESIQKDIEILIQKKKDLEIKINEDRLSKIKEIEQFKSSDYVCIYNPYDSNNWFIEKNPDFNDPFHFGISVEGIKTFVLKKDLKDYGL